MKLNELVEWLTLRPMALVVQSGARRSSGLLVRTMMCCTSRQVRSGFASRARATMPAAIGAEAVARIDEN